MSELSDAEVTRILDHKYSHTRRKSKLRFLYPTREALDRRILWLNLTLKILRELRDEKPRRPRGRPRKTDA